MRIILDKIWHNEKSVIRLAEGQEKEVLQNSEDAIRAQSYRTLFVCKLRIFAIS